MHHIAPLFTIDEHNHAPNTTTRLVCMHKLSNTICCLLLALSCVWVPAAYAANEKQPEQSKQALDALHQKLESMKKALGTSQEAHKDAADALRESELAISLANKKLYEINQLQQKNKLRLSKLGMDTESINQQLVAQQKLLSQQLYQQYTQGQQSSLQIILQNEHPSEIARDLHYFTYLAQARAALIKKMQANLSQLNQLNEKTAKTLEEVNTLKQAQIDQKRALEQQKLAKSEVVKTLSEQINLQRGEIKKLARDEKNLSALVERLAKLARAKEKKLASRPVKKIPSINGNESKNRPKEIVAHNDAEPNADYAGSNFASLKGKLRLPVRGSVLNRFGNSREDTGISWKGLFIQAAEGAEVKSVANGRVVFADWMRGFGNLIIVDHGNGYMSLYGNNQAVLKSVGTTVNAGDVIASVGNSGGNETNGLYYELRKQSRPFDPLSWSNLN
jgi:septal ring factor EnvC (AmiA/AmiB activator)